MVFDSGGYGAFKPTVYLRGADHLCGVYRIPHARIDSYMVYTNNVPKGHMRSPAKPQVVFAVEAHTDLVARELGMDPYEFRQKNLLQNGDASPVGHVWQDIRAEETLRRAAEAIGWEGVSPHPNPLPEGEGAVMEGVLTGTRIGDHRPLAGCGTICSEGKHELVGTSDAAHGVLGHGHRLAHRAAADGGAGTVGAGG